MEDQILTPHFRLFEFSRSSTADSKGIDNSVPSELIPLLRNLCERVLEPLRQHVSEPVIISSGYRCPELNRRVGGASNSQHLTGEAADICVNNTPKLRQWYLWMAENLPYDQLILAKKGKKCWIHVSCKLDPSENRQCIFRKTI